MELLKKYASDIVSYFSSNDYSRTSKKQILESKVTLGKAIRGSNFYLLKFLKPQSIIELLLVNKELNTILSDDVINEYGKRIKGQGFLGPSLQAYDLCYREYFVQQLRISSKSPDNYEFRGTFTFRVYQGINDKIGTIHTIQSGERITHVPKSWFEAGNDVHIKPENVLLIIQPTFRPSWLRDEGPPKLWYGQNEYSNGKMNCDLDSPSFWFHIHNSLEDMVDKLMGDNNRYLKLHFLRHPLHNIDGVSLCLDLILDEAQDEGMETIKLLFWYGNTLHTAPQLKKIENFFGIQ